MSSSRPFIWVSQALVLAILFSTALAARQVRPDRPPAAQRQRPAAEQNAPRIRAEVNLVSVLVSVTDAHHRPTPDLSRELFSLEEEGVPQKIDFFEPETQQPLDLILMVDASLSTLKELAAEREAAAHFIRQVVRPGDRLSVYQFDETVTKLSNFSNDVAQLQSAVRRITEGAGTSLYDAVFFGARAFGRNPSDRRRVIVLVTDAGETTSRTDFDTARKEALLSGTLLYSVIIRAVKGENGRSTAGEHALEAITDTTGGAMFFPDSVQDLDAIFDRIDRELRTQFRLGYYPHPRGPASTFRSITVRVKGNYEVRHRKGYFTAPE